MFFCFFGTDVVSQSSSASHRTKPHVVTIWAVRDRDSAREWAEVLFQCIFEFLGLCVSALERCAFVELIYIDDGSESLSHLR